MMAEPYRGDEVCGNKKIKVFLYIWESLRPKEWTKNLVIFAGVLFSQNLFNLPYLFKVFLAFITFCLLSGSVYIFNDLRDVEEDKSHPFKSNRPLASDRLQTSHALLALVIFVPLALGFSYYLNSAFFLITLGYLLLQVAYSFILKYIVILDVFTISCGFLLRVIAGAVVINVEISSWFLLCTTLISLFLGLSKRRHELVMLEQEAQNHRKVLGKYSPYLLDQMISAVTASTILAYALYTMSEETIAKFGTKNLIFTIPYILYGIFRYLYLIHQKGSGGNPGHILLNDKPLFINILLWVITVVIILYG